MGITRKSANTPLVRKLMKKPSETKLQEDVQVVEPQTPLTPEPPTPDEGESIDTDEHTVSEGEWPVDMDEDPLAEQEPIDNTDTVCTPVAFDSSSMLMLSENELNKRLVRLIRVQMRLEQKRAERLLAKKNGKNGKRKISDDHNSGPMFVVVKDVVEKRNYPHLDEWRVFLNEWRVRNAEFAASLPQAQRAVYAGFAYRHVKGKKRETDPPLIKYM